LVFPPFENHSHHSVNYAGDKVAAFSTAYIIILSSDFSITSPAKIGMSIKRLFERVFVAIITYVQIVEAKLTEAIK
jgi:hypothetical protein